MRGGKGRNKRAARLAAPALRGAQREREATPSARAAAAFACGESLLMQSVDCSRERVERLSVCSESAADFNEPGSAQQFGCGGRKRTSSTPVPSFADVSTYPASPSSSTQASTSALLTARFFPALSGASPSSSPSPSGAQRSPLFPTSRMHRSCSPHCRRSASQERQLANDDRCVRSNTSSAPPAPR